MFFFPFSLSLNLSMVCAVYCDLLHNGGIQNSHNIQWLAKLCLPRRAKSCESPWGLKWFLWGSQIPGEIDLEMSTGTGGTGRGGGPSDKILLLIASNTSQCSPPDLLDVLLIFLRLPPCPVVIRGSLTTNPSIPQPSSND